MLIHFIVIDKYRAGYSDCAREVARYLATPEPPPLPTVPSLTDAGCKARLLRHLDTCIAEIDKEICPFSANVIDKTDNNSRGKWNNSSDSSLSEVSGSCHNLNPLDFSRNRRDSTFPENYSGRTILSNMLSSSPQHMLPTPLTTNMVRLIFLYFGFSSTN